MPAAQSARRTAVPLPAWAAIVLVVALGALTPNPELTAASVLVIPLFVHLLARPGEPPILLYVVMLQWLQVATRVFHADLEGVLVSDIGEGVGMPVEYAIVLGLAALIALCLGLRVGSGLMAPRQRGERASESLRMSPSRLFVVYIALMVGGQGLIHIGWSMGGLQQLISPLAYLKWVALFALGVTVFSGHEGKAFLAAATGMEVLLGLGGYFSDFKTVFFVLVIAALSAGVRLTWRRIVAATICAGVALMLIVVWTGVKEKYRAYLNQGTNAQVVLVPWAERMGYLADRVRDLDGKDVVQAVEDAAFRLEYVDYFARVLEYVPEVRPHTDGALWLGAVRHILLPRAFFPEKPVLPSDSELTMRYTGWFLASDAQGASISLGYVAESFIDFGRTGMWLPVFLLGVLWGAIYGHFIGAASSPVFGYGFAVAALLPTIYYETAAVKQLGGTHQPAHRAGARAAVCPATRHPLDGGCASGGPLAFAHRPAGPDMIEPLGSAASTLRVSVFCGGSYVSGMEIKALDLMVGLRARGHDVRCVASGWNDGDFLGRLTAYEIPYETARLGKLTKSVRPVPLWWMFNTLIRLPGALWHCRRHLRRFNPDVVLLFNRDAALLLTPLLRGRKCVFHVAEVASASAWDQRLAAIIDAQSARLDRGVRVRRPRPCGPGNSTREDHHRVQRASLAR